LTGGEKTIRKTRGKRQWGKPGTGEVGRKDYAHESRGKKGPQGTYGLEKSLLTSCLIGRGSFGGKFGGEENRGGNGQKSFQEKRP